MSKARDIADLDFNSPDIDGGNIDGATIGASTAAAGSFTGLSVDGSGLGVGGLLISNSTHNHAALSFARSSTATARIHLSEPDALHTGQLNFQTSDASGGSPNLVTAMVIDDHQNATFKGNVTIDHDDADPYLIIDGSTGSRDSGVKINSGNGERQALRQDAGNNLYIGNNNLLINSSGNVSMAGNLAVTGTQQTGNITVIGASSGAEGGEIFLAGAGSNEGINIDNYNGTFRIFDGSSPAVRLDLDSDGNAIFAGNVTADNFYGNVPDNSSIVLSQGTGTTRPSYAMWGPNNGTYPGQIHIVSNTSNSSAVSGNVGFWEYNGSWNNHVNFGKGGYILNDGGQDRDFRVESAGNTHMLFIDAGNNRVSIGKNSPNYVLDVKNPDASPSTVTAAFRAGSDADDNRSNIFIGQNDNSRGLLIQGGRETGDRAIAEFILNGSGGTIGSNILNWLQVYEKTGSTHFEVTVNQDGENVDFRVESDTIPHMFFMDGSASKIGIATNAPFGSRLHVVDTGWSSGSPYGSVVHLDGGSNHDNNWGHLHVNQSGTGANTGGRIRLGTSGNNGFGGNPIAGITALNKDTTNGQYGNLEFSTRPSGGTNQMRMELSHNGHIKLSGDHGIRVFTGYFSGGTTTANFDVTGYSQGIMMMSAAFNHYGFVTTYGAFKHALCSNGPGHGGTSIQVNDITTEISTSLGGSFTFQAQNGVRDSYRITKNAGTYAGGGYYWVRFEGNMGV